MRKVVVVFPFVPVTPTTLIFCEGWRKYAAERSASAWRAFKTSMAAAREVRPGFSLTMAAAPRSIAESMNSVPSAFSPGSATKSAPSTTLRES